MNEGRTVAEGAIPGETLQLQDKDGHAVATLKADSTGRVAWTPTKAGSCKGFTLANPKTAPPGASAAANEPVTPGPTTGTVIIGGLIYY